MERKIELARTDGRCIICPVINKMKSDECEKCAENEVLNQ